MKELNPLQIVSIAKKVKEKSDWQIIPERTIKRFFVKDKVIPPIVSMWRLGDILFNSEYNAKYSVTEFLDKFNKEVYIEDGKIYYRPYFIIKTSDGKQHFKRFDSISQMQLWYNENILPYIKTIIIE